MTGPLVRPPPGPYSTEGVDDVKTPILDQHTAVIVAAAAAAQTLPAKALAVLSAAQASTTAYGVATALTPVASGLAAGDIEFTGTSSAPSATVTLNSAATADQVLTVTYVPLGALAPAQ